MTDTTKELLAAWRSAIEEWNAATDALMALAEARGRTEPGIPFFVRSDDREMLAAIQREQEAQKAAQIAMERVFAVTP
jgi:hypothetical protein